MTHYSLSSDDILNLCSEAIELQSRMADLSDRLTFVKHCVEDHHQARLFLADAYLKESRLKLQQTLNYLQPWM